MLRWREIGSGAIPEILGGKAEESIGLVDKGISGDLSENSKIPQEGVG